MLTVSKPYPKESRDNVVRVARMRMAAGRRRESNRAEQETV